MLIGMNRYCCETEDMIYGHRLGSVQLVWRAGIVDQVFSLDATNQEQH